MKKLLAVVLALCLLPLCAFAEVPGEELIETPGLNVWLVPPEDTILMLRDSSASVFNRAGLWQPDMVAYMEENDIYAVIVPEEDPYAWECTLAIWPEEAEDLAGVTDFMAEVLCKEYRTMYEEAGYTVDEVVYYLSGGYEYMRLQCRFPYEDGTEGHVCLYGTNQNGYALWLDIMPYEGPVGEAQMQLLADMIDTVWCEVTE